MTIGTKGLAAVLIVLVGAAVLSRSVRTIVLLLAAIPMAAGAAYWVYGRWLKGQWNRKWGGAGKRTLLVYSRSPHWQAHIEAEWLPRLGDRVVLLDWSDRSKWSDDVSLEVKVFRYWAGDREFNPIAILFPPKGRVRAIRFWRAFRDFKHGKEHTLRRAEQELFDFVSHTDARAV